MRKSKKYLKQTITELDALAEQYDDKIVVHHEVEKPALPIFPNDPLIK